MASSSRWLWIGAGLLLLLGVLLVLLLFWPGAPARLVVRTVPAGVSVMVDGVLRGTTADTGLALVLLKGGHYHLALSRSGYLTDTSTVWIGGDEVLELEAVMVIPGMAFIRGGVFEMGSEAGEYNERPAHRVYVEPFYIDRREVRAAEYRRFRPGYRPLFPGAEMPAGNVSWAEARDYCRSLGKRLPTEAEWERACRGPRGARYSTGDTYDPRRARIGLDLGTGPAPVGSYTPGNGGLYDMTGNLWEWCSDWYGRDYYRGSPERTPRGPDGGTQHVLRGGAWFSNARYSRCTHRPGNIQKERDPSFGFRCVKDVE